MQVSQAVEQYKDTLSPETSAAHLNILTAFADWYEESYELEELEAKDIPDVVKRIVPRQTHKPLPIRMMYDYTEVIRKFLEWCAEERLVSKHLPGNIEELEIDEPEIVEVLTDDQIRRLFKVCKKGIWPARDTAILYVLKETGMSATELCDLTLENVSPDPRKAFIDILGKGGHHTRQVGLSNHAGQWLEDYIKKYRYGVAPKEENHVFLTLPHGNPLTRDQLDQILQSLRDQAQLEGVQCTPDTLRQTFAVNSLKHSKDIHSLTYLMGFTSINTTDNFLGTFKNWHLMMKRPPSLIDSMFDNDKPVNRRRWEKKAKTNH